MREPVGRGKLFGPSDIIVSSGVPTHAGFVTIRLSGSDEWAVLHSDSFELALAEGRIAHGTALQ